MQTCIWPSWCHCHSLSLASVKSTLVLSFWYRLTRVVRVIWDWVAGPWNGCVCVCMWQTNTEPPHLAAYSLYIDHELKEADPVRVLCIFERAIVDNCLQPDLWTRYVNYVVCVFMFFRTFRLHRMGSIDAGCCCRCLDVILCVCWSRPWAPQKWMNRSRCHLRCELREYVLDGGGFGSRHGQDRDKWRKYVHGVANPRIEDR